MISTCPNCHKPVRPGAKFCPACGCILSSSPGPQTPKPNTGTKLISTDPRLVVREGGAVREVVLGNAPITIGRDPSINTLVVGQPTQYNPQGYPDVSRSHARIVPNGHGGYTVEDLRSANGTYLRGQRLPPSQPTPLQDGDVIRIGAGHGNAVSIAYQLSGDMGQPPVTVALNQAQLASLPRISLGRLPGNTVTLASPVVSGQHAEIVRMGQGAHEIIDRGSANGTFVNGRRIQRATLKRGDVIQIGPYRLSYSPTGIQQATNTGNVRLDGVQLNKIVRDGGKTKVLLNQISLSVLPREFIALVGGSGAGKSTLMDALNGSRRAAGQVLINGDNLYQNFDAYRANMGYVPQADILHTNIPVQRALNYTAMLRLDVAARLEDWSSWIGRAFGNFLRLPLDTPFPSINQRVGEVLQMVDMGSKENLPIHKLSGGQKKRVSIASELLSDPSLLFLDEPTSGLDPGLDKKMMYTLNQLADQSGRTIVLTTHATNNILDTCHHVAFLAHGRLVYFGPPVEAMKFFNAPDFATIYSMVETPQEAEQVEQKFRSSSDYQQYVAQRQAGIPRAAIAGVRQAGFNFDLRAALKQFAILALRYLDLIINDKFSLFVLSAVMPIIGILLNIIANAKSLVGDTAVKIDELLEANGYYNIVTDAQKLLLMLALSVILLGVFAAAYEIIKERPVYNRERMINLGIVPYLASKIAVLMIFGLIQCFALLVVVSVKVEIPDQGVLFPAFFEMYITLILAMLASVSLGLLVSALVNSGNTVIYLILVILFMQIIFSGALFELPDSARPISYITPTRWALEGLGSTVDMNELNGLSQTKVRDGPAAGAVLEAPVDFSINYDSNVGHLFGTWFVQIFFAGLFISATGFVLKQQDVK